MGPDSLRVQHMGKWLYRRYVADLQAGDQAGAMKFAETLFFLRYGMGRNILPQFWAGFETELFRLAHTGQDPETAYRTVVDV
jgi:hypothetical protein